MDAVPAALAGQSPDAAHQAASRRPLRARLALTLTGFGLLAVLTCLLARWSAARTSA